MKAEHAQRQLVAADPERPPEERCAALEEIFEVDLGDTTLVRGRDVEQQIGLRQIHLKLEGENPTGTYEDRAACAHVLEALRRGFDAIAVAAYDGSSGASVAQAGSLCGLRCVVHVASDYDPRQIERISHEGGTVVRVPGNYESAIGDSRRQAVRQGCYDANASGPNTDLEQRAFGQIAYEIFDELRDAPAAVALPVPSGALLEGIHRGFASLYRRGKTSHVPRMVAGFPVHRGPLDDEDTAATTVRRSNGWVGRAENGSMTGWSRRIRDHEGVFVPPTATAGLVALLDRHNHETLPPDRYVVLLTEIRVQLD